MKLSTIVFAGTLLTGCAIKSVAQGNSIVLCDQQSGSASQCMTLSAPAVISANFAATLPGANASGALVNNGSGALSWSNLAGIYCALAGGAGCTMTGSILASGTPNIGSATNAFSNIYGTSWIGTYADFQYGGSPVLSFGATGSTDVVVSAAIWGVLMDWNSGGSVTIGNATHQVNLLPAVADNNDLGSSGAEWNNTWTKYLHVANLATLDLVTVTPFAGGGNQCVQANNAGQLQVTGALCGGSGTYLPLAGGTMTGNILMSGSVNIGSGTTAVNNAFIYETVASYVQFQYGGTPVITIGEDGSGNLDFTTPVIGNLMSLNAGGSLTLGSATQVVPLFPATNASTDLGSATAAWRNVYATTLGLGESPESGIPLSIYTGSTAVPGLRIRRYTPGYYYSDLEHTSTGGIEALAVLVANGSSGESEIARFNANGTVSVGNTNSTYNLDVTGTGRFTGAITVASCTGCGGGSSYWTLSGTNLYPASTSDYVGIGNTSPSYPLDVTGVARVGSCIGCVGSGQTTGMAGVSRFISTPYHNTNSYPITVVVTILPASYTANVSTATVVCDSSSSPSTPIGAILFTSTGGGVQMVTFKVPVGYWYEIVQALGTQSISQWTEYPD